MLLGHATPRVSSLTRPGQEKREQNEMIEPTQPMQELGFCQKKVKYSRVTHAVKSICRERASKRWSALLTQTHSRIGGKCGMRKRLGEANWAAFVRYAEAEYKESFFAAFTPSTDTLCSEGRLDGSPCPVRVRIDLTQTSSIQCGEELPRLHMDHTHDVTHICKVWSDALPTAPRSWDEGVCGPLVAHLLFGTRDHEEKGVLWRKQLCFRCGDVRGVGGQSADDFCHDVARAHYAHQLKVADISRHDVSRHEASERRKDEKTEEPRGNS